MFHDKEFGFYFESSMELLGHYEQESEVTIFLNDSADGNHI